ncbi:MAG: hypothetical protein EOO25_13870, partial [Comamonadaceae bacterium]
MNRSALALAAVLSTVGFAAQAETPDPSGQYAKAVTQQQAAVQAEGAKSTHAAAPGNSANPWSTRFNQLDGFRSERTRAEVTADYIASRSRVAAFTGEDSGAA